MKAIMNEKAVYLIFPNDPANIQHSADELAQIARGLEGSNDLFRPVIEALFALERKMKQVPESGTGNGGMHT